MMLMILIMVYNSDKLDQTFFLVCASCSVHRVRFGLSSLTFQITGMIWADLKIILITDLGNVSMI